MREVFVTDDLRSYALHRLLPGVEPLRIGGQAMTQAASPDAILRGRFGRRLTIAAHKSKLVRTTIS